MSFRAKSSLESLRNRSTWFGTSSHVLQWWWPDAQQDQISADIFRDISAKAKQIANLPTANRPTVLFAKGPVFGKSLFRKKNGETATDDSSPSAFPHLWTYRMCYNNHHG